MRDTRFIAEHRGGPLPREQHYQLVDWARACAEHVLPLLSGLPDERLIHALDVARRWPLGKATVGEAMKASVAAHAVARKLPDPVAIFVARSVGQAVATAHMADHSLGAAWYALKAVKSSGGSTESEREWQDNQLPPEIRELVLSARQSRKI
jgi:hypothetical protein